MALDPLSPSVTPVNPELDAIAYNESRGKYDVKGQPTPTGDKAYGRYQFMGQYIPALTKQHLGTEMTPEQFLKNPEAQDKVAEARWNELRQKHTPEEAAKVWAGGEGALKTNEKDSVSGQTTDDYGKKYTEVHNQLHPQLNTGYAPLPENTKQDLIALNVDPVKYAQNVAAGIEKGGDDYYKAYKSLYATYDRTATPEQHANNAFQLATTGGQPVVKTVLHAGDDFKSAFSNSFTDLFANIKEVGATLEHKVGLTDEKQFKAQTQEILKQKAFDRLRISENGQKDPFSRLPDGSINWNGIAAGGGGLVGGFGTLAPAIVVGGIVTAMTAGADLPFLAVGASAAEAGVIEGLTYGDLASMAGTSLTMGIQGYGSHYEEGLQRGLDNDSAATYGGIGALAYGLIGAIPGGALSKKLFGIEAKELSEPLIKQALDNGGIMTKEMLNDYMPEIADGLKNAVKRRMLRAGKAVLEEGAVTGSVMGAQTALDKIATIQYAKIANQQDKFRDVLDKTAEENFVDVFKSTATGMGIGAIFGLGTVPRSAAHPTMYGYIEENAKKPENLNKLKAMIADYGEKTGKKELADKLVGDVDDMTHVANTYLHLVKDPDARYQIFQLGEESKKTAIGSEHAIEQKKALEDHKIDQEVVEKDKAKWDEVIKLNGQKQQLITEFKKQIGDTKKPIDYNAYTKAAKELDSKIKATIDATEGVGQNPSEPVSEKQPDPFEQKPTEPAAKKEDFESDLDKVFGTGKAVAPKTVKDVLDVPITMGGTKGFLSMREDGGIDFTMTKSGKTVSIATKEQAPETLAKHFDAIGIQPENVDQFQLQNKMEVEQVAAKKEAEKKALPPIPIESLNGKEVVYKGKKGVLSVDEGGKTSFETPEGKVYDISTEQNNRNARDYGIEPVKEKPVEPKYNVSEVSETGATVNGVKYSIQTDEKGNISGISPADKPEQSIKNEKLLAAVESERNKLDYKVGESATSEQIDGIVKLLAPEEQAAETLIDNIHASNATPEVAEAVSILTANNKTESVKYLTPEQHAAVTDWALKSLSDLQALQKEERFKDSAQIKAAIDNLDYITKLADNNVESTNTGREGIENGAGAKNNAPETKQESTGLAEADKSNDGAPDKTIPRKTGEGETTTAAQGDKNEADNKGAEGDKQTSQNNGNEIESGKAGKESGKAGKESGKQGTLFQKQGGKPIEKATVSLIDRTLKKATPGIKVNYHTGEVFEKLHPGEEALGVLNPDGTVDYNMAKITGQTQTHEMGHVFVSWAKKYAPDLYRHMMETAAKETDLLNKVSENYPELDGHRLHEEALVAAIGESGEKLIPDLKEPITIGEKLKVVVSEMWDKFKTYIKNRLGVKDNRFDNLKDMPFAQLTASIAKELLSGKELTKMTSEELAGIEKDGITRYMKADEAKRKFEQTDYVKGAGGIPHTIGVGTAKHAWLHGIPTATTTPSSHYTLSLNSLGKLRQILGKSETVTPEHVKQAVYYFGERLKKQINKIESLQGGSKKHVVGFDDIKAIADMAGTTPKFEEAVKGILDLVHSTKKPSEKMTKNEWGAFIKNKIAHPETGWEDVLKDLPSVVDVPFEDLPKDLKEKLGAKADIEAVSEATNKFDIMDLPQEARDVFTALPKIEKWLDTQEQLQGNLIDKGGSQTTDPNMVKAKLVGEVKPFLGKYKGKNEYLDKAIDTLGHMQLYCNDISTYAVQWTADPRSLLSDVVYGLKKAVGSRYRLMVNASEPLKPLMEYLGAQTEVAGGDGKLPFSIGKKKLTDLGGVYADEFLKPTDEIKLKAHRDLGVPENPHVMMTKGERLKALWTLNREDVNHANFGENGKGYIEFELPERKGERKATRVYITEEGRAKLLAEVGDKMPELMKAVDESMGIMNDAENPVHQQLTGLSIPRIEGYAPDRVVRGDESFDQYNKTNGYLRQQSFMMKRAVEGTEVYEMRDMAEVLAHRINQGSKYATRAIPEHNFETSLNHLKGIAKEKGMEQYINWGNKYLSRLNTPEAKIGELEGKITRNYVLAAIGINPGVDLKHLSTLFFANNVIPQKYLLQSAYLVPKTYAEIVKNADIFVGDDKHWSPEMQRAMKNDFFASRKNMMNTEFQQMVQEGRSFTFKTTVGGKAHEINLSGQDVMVGLKTMETANGLATYVAAEKYVSAEFPHLKEGSDEYNELVGDKYMDAILQSQPAMDDINTPFFQAGAYSEAKGPLHRALSLFTGQVFAQWNGMAQQMMIASEDPTPKNNFKFAKSVANIFILNTLMVGTIDAAKQQALGKSVKDKDKQWLEDMEESGVKSMPIIGGVMAAVLQKMEGKPFQGDLSLPVLEWANKGTSGIADVLRDKPENGIKELTDFGAYTLGIPMTAVKAVRKAAQ